MIDRIAKSWNLIYVIASTGEFYTIHLSLTLCDFWRYYHSTRILLEKKIPDEIGFV